MRTTIATNFVKSVTDFVDEIEGIGRSWTEGFDGHGVENVVVCL